MRMIPSLRIFLFAVSVLAMSTASFAQMRISVGFGPPALPVYEQPLCPGVGKICSSSQTQRPEDLEKGKHGGPGQEQGAAGEMLTARQPLPHNFHSRSQTEKRR